MNTEKIFDILPQVVEIFEKLDIPKFVENNKGKDEKELGINLIKHILKNTRKFKTEFFEVIAILEEITIEEAKELSLSDLSKILKEIGDNRELVNFFKSFMQ